VDDTYTLYALRYATRMARHADHFAGEVPDPDRPMPMDYFVWLAVNGKRSVLIDTGFKREVGIRRKRTYLSHPAEMLMKLGVNPSDLEDIVLTHLHYDHAGTIDSFRSARFHLQERELEFATGRGSEPTRRAFEATDVANVVQATYARRTVLHDGSASLWPGIEVHLVGGHTPGMQIVRVRTARGWVVLAADASHFYENMESVRCFHGTHDTERNKASFALIRELADSPAHVIPGHDPQVMVRYPPISSDPGIAGVRLDCPPLELHAKELAGCAA
jgi:glyoxylase-like metal-dependent hydrolase (beta-lactamase superfamily II)